MVTEMIKVNSRTMNKKYCYNCMNETNENGKCSYCSFDLNEYEIQPHQLIPGTILNERYVVGKVLGEGGFGITYVGLDETLGLKVAIKEFYMTGFVNRNNTISCHISAETGAKGELFKVRREKFYDEARVLARFNTEPGIVSVRDFFYENDTAYIIMDFIEGITLKDYLKEKKRLSVQEALTIMSPIFDSLEAIHNAGIIHRDISPDNIILMNNNQVKLIDFGAARQYDDDNKSLSVILKPGYAPEEQYRSKGIQGPWTDVYAIAATLYRCISGKRPEDALERLVKDNTVELYVANAECPKALSDVIMKGLAIYQDKRYKTMSEMKGEIEKAFGSVSNKETIVSRAKVNDVKNKESNRLRIKEGTGKRIPVFTIVLVISTWILFASFILISFVVTMISLSIWSGYDYMTEKTINGFFVITLLAIVTVIILTPIEIVIGIILKILNKSNDRIWIPYNKLLFDGDVFGNYPIDFVPKERLYQDTIDNFEIKTEYLYGTYKIPSDKVQEISTIPNRAFKDRTRMVPIVNQVFSDYSKKKISDLPFQMDFDSSNLCSLFFFTKNDPSKNYYVVKAKFDLIKENDQDYYHLLLKQVVGEKDGEPVMSVQSFEYCLRYEGYRLTLFNNKSKVFLYSQDLSISKKHEDKAFYKAIYLARNPGISNIDKILIDFQNGDKNVVKIYPNRESEVSYDVVATISEKGIIKISYLNDVKEKCCGEFLLLMNGKQLIITTNNDTYFFDKLEK